MGLALAEQHFSNFEVGKWLNGWFVAKEEQVFITYLKDGQSV